MKAVILAGGLGSRLSEETDRIPKPLVQVGERPILWHVMKGYSTHGINDFVICLGYKGYAIKEYFQNYFLHTSDVTIDVQQRSMQVHEMSTEPWRITLIDTGADTMTGGRLRRIARFVNDEPFCMTYGDGVADVDITGLIAFHKLHSRLATVTVVSPPGRFGSVEVRDAMVTEMREKPVNGGALINGGFFVLDPRALDYASGDSSVWEREPMEQLARDGQLMAWHHRGFWQPMDTLRDKRLLDDLWRSGKAPWKTWS